MRRYFTYLKSNVCTKFIGVTSCHDGLLVTVVTQSVEFSWSRVGGLIRCCSPHDANGGSQLPSEAMMYGLRHNRHDLDRHPPC